MLQPLQQLEFQEAIRIYIFMQLMMIKRHMKMVIVLVTCSDLDCICLWLGTGLIRDSHVFNTKAPMRDCYETFHIPENPF